MLMELNMRKEDVKGKKFYYGRGCEKCNNTGHKGRCGIHELLVMNDNLRDLIVSGGSTDERLVEEDGLEALAALQQPDAFQRLVDRLPDDNAIHGLKVWGAMHGLYPDTGGMGATPGPGAQPRVTRHGGHDHAAER